MGTQQEKEKMLISKKEPISYISTKIIEKIEKTKNDYFNINKNVAELESKIIHLNKSKNKKEEEFKKNSLPKLNKNTKLSLRLIFLNF